MGYPLREQACSHRGPRLFRHNAVKCGSGLAREGVLIATIASPANKNGSLTGLPLYLPPLNHSNQTRQHLPGFALLAVVAFGHHLVEDVAGTIVVAHVDVGLGQVELGGDFIGT